MAGPDGAKMRVLVTGANGFVGAAALPVLRGLPGVSTIGALRSFGPGMDDPQRYVEIGALGRNPVPAAALAGVDVVVHTAARVHVMRDRVVDPLAAFREVNVEGTMSLARQAAGAGVRRLVFLSSVKVHGEATEPGNPWLADSPPSPNDPYAQSKYEAEQQLRVLAEETGLEVVIIRPPLVHGPGVKANFLAMMKLLYRGVPLPLGVTGNKRSLVGLDNLVDLIALCVRHPEAANHSFLVSDGEDFSTTDMLRHLGAALGRPARLFPVPASLLKLAAAATRKDEVYRRIFGSLQVDIAKNRNVLGWQPPVPARDALALTARWFLEAEKNSA